VRVDRHFVQEPAKMKKGVGHSRVAVTNFLENQSVMISFNSGESGASARYATFLSEFVGSFG